MTTYLGDPLTSIYFLLRSSPNSKRLKSSAALGHSNRSSAQHQAALLTTSASAMAPSASYPIPAQTPQPLQPANPRKRRSTPVQAITTMPGTRMTDAVTGVVVAPAMPDISDSLDTTPKKKGRTNTPWTAEEEQRLKAMRDAGKSWSEIAKVNDRLYPHQPLIHVSLIVRQTFPARTEGSVKKHWYKVKSTSCYYVLLILTMNALLGYALCWIRRGRSTCYPYC